MAFRMAGSADGWDTGGDFVFGEYPEMLIRDEDSGDWWERGGLSAKLEEPEERPVGVGNFREESGREVFIESVRRIQEWIAAGDIYQVNVAQSFPPDKVP